MVSLERFGFGRFGILVTSGGLLNVAMSGACILLTPFLDDC